MQAIAIASITRWLMPPESWCGKASRRRSASGISTSFSSCSARARRARARAAFVQRDRLHQLEGDRERRVQACHRVLEDHRDLAAEERPALALGHRLQVAAGEGEALGGQPVSLRDTLLGVVDNPVTLGLNTSRSFTSPTSSQPSSPSLPRPAASSPSPSFSTEDSARILYSHRLSDGSRKGRASVSR